MRTWLLGVTTAALLVGACGPGESIVTSTADRANTTIGAAESDTGGREGSDADTVEPGPDESDADGPAIGGPGIDELGLRCGQVEFSSPTIDLSSLPVFDQDLAQLVGEGDLAAEFDFIAEWVLGMKFYEISRTANEIVVLGEQSDSATGLAPYFGATFERVDGEWRAVGFGECLFESNAAGFGVAQIALDAEDEPTAESVSLTVLATERACASGLAPTDREIWPTVVESDQSVQIVVLVEQSTGAQTCQGNPSFPLEIELAGPLGKRTILDIALAPPTELVWPIPLRSSQLNVVLLGDKPGSERANVFTWDDPFSGGLLLQDSGWGDEPGWIQSFGGDEPRTISGFVGTCLAGDCDVEECEGAGCDDLERLGPECMSSYAPMDAVDTTFTITYAATACTIEVTTTPIG